MIIIKVITNNHNSKRDRKSLFKSKKKGKQKKVFISQQEIGF